jgi:DNA-binding GntR family transcriptional regulator
MPLMSTNRPTSTALLSAAATSSGRHHTAHEFVLSTLWQAILDGSLSGGTRLVQAQIAVELNVSTTPVREALRDLAAHGLIHLDNHRGAVVAVMSAKDMADIYDVRLVLEPLAGRLAAQHASDEQLAVMASLQELMDAEPAVGAWAQRNREFHHVLADASGNPRLATILKRLQDAASIYVSAALRTTPSDRRPGNEHHRAILAALHARDPERAAAAVLQHLETTVAIVDGVLHEHNEMTTDHISPSRAG